MPKFHSVPFRVVVNLVQKVLAAPRRLQPRPFIEAERVLHLLERLGNVRTTERTEKTRKKAQLYVGIKPAIF